MNTKQPENLELLPFLLFGFYHNLLLNGEFNFGRS